MPPIRILVVDDSVVVRKLLTDALASCPEVVVAGTASNGSIALLKIPQLNPDVITLDIEMPGMNGLETLAEIRKSYPKLPVIMFSTLTERGASITLEALSLGASDYVTKPTNSESLGAAMDHVRRELVAKITSLAARRTPGVVAAPVVPVARPKPNGKKVDILAIGSSTGGPNALGEILPKLPKDLPVPIVIVQHMPPLFTKLLAERLNSRSQIKVREAEEEKVLEPGVAWIAPGDYHMTVERKGVNSLALSLNQDPQENYCRPAVDVLFRSVAQLSGINALSVVLTGMGSDGTRGAERIREVGGEVLIQDEATSVVWGMPGSIAAAGLADAVYPIGRLANEITRRIQPAKS